MGVIPELLIDMKGPELRLSRNLKCIQLEEGSIVNEGIFDFPKIIHSYLMQMLTLMIRFQVESVWTFVGIACTLISAAMVIYTKKHCAIHDCIAKTKVVEVKANETTN